MSECQSNVGTASRLAGNQLIRMRASHKASCTVTQADSRVFGEKGFSDTQRHQWDNSRIPRQERDGRFRRIDAYPLLERVLRSEQISVVEVDFIPPPAEVIADVTEELALCRDEWSNRPNRDVVPVDRHKRPVVAGTSWIKETVAIEVIVPRSFALVIHTGQQRKEICELLHIFCAGSAGCPKLALADEPLSEVRIERQIVSPEEA